MGESGTAKQQAGMHHDVRVERKRGVKVNLKETRLHLGLDKKPVQRFKKRILMDRTMRKKNLEGSMLNRG